MTSPATGQLAHIYRHPIKAHGREALASVRLLTGKALPWDRHWAVAHDLSKFDPAAPAWVGCGNFQRGARTPAVMAIEARFEEASGRLTLSHPQLPDLSFLPASEGGKLMDWLRPISPTERFRPKALVHVPDRALTDSDFPSVSIKNLASHAAVAAHMGRDVSIHRWRGNLWLEGFAPWAEFDWIGKRLKIGGTVIEVKERIGRCKATTVDPATGEVGGDTLGALRALVGEQDFGVYGIVIQGGDIKQGDPVEVLQ